MKLLFDENLSPRLVKFFEKKFPGSAHIELVTMRGCKDAEVWDYARANGFTIVSKDNDFRQRAFLYGQPPKVIWLSIGNAGTDFIANLLRSRISKVIAFIDNPDESLLVLEKAVQVRQ